MLVNVIWQSGKGGVGDIAEEDARADEDLQEGGGVASRGDH